MLWYSDVVGPALGIDPVPTLFSNLTRPDPSARPMRCQELWQPCSSCSGSSILNVLGEGLLCQRLWRCFSRHFHFLVSQTYSTGSSKEATESAGRSSTTTLASVTVVLSSSYADALKYVCARTGKATEKAAAAETRNAAAFSPVLPSSFSDLFQGVHER